MKLLTDEEIEQVIGKVTKERYIARHATPWEAEAIAKAQLAKDEAECQARVEQLFTDYEIDHLLKALRGFYTDDDPGWCVCCESAEKKLLELQSLKKQEGVDV